MSIVPMSELLADARARGYAVGCFNAIDMQLAHGILQAAESLRSPVILAHAEVHLKYASLEEIAPILVTQAERARVPVAILYDHGVDFGSTVKAMQLGFNAVMYDGSRLPYAENAANTAEMVKIAAAMGCEVEGELGSVMRPKSGGAEGEDDDATISDTSVYTDPAQAAEFVERTGVSCLAVAFGTVHGVYLKEPKLDLARLADIRSAVDVPLVMHGGSGLSAQDFKDSIASGISKINYYTDMARSAARYVRDQLNTDDSALFYHNVLSWTRERVAQEVERALTLFGSAGKA